MRTANALTVCAVLFPVAAAAQASPRLNVVIVDRQISGTNYSYVVPGHLFAQSNSNANCFDTANSVNCSGGTRTTASVTPPSSVSYDVRGATFTLRLPDGRLVVVNCESKYALKFDYINRRSCRIPLVNEIQAEFDGDKAKLEWPVSIDGKKTQTETYKILAILSNPNAEATTPAVAGIAESTRAAAPAPSGIVETNYPWIGSTRQKLYFRRDCDAAKAVQAVDQVLLHSETEAAGLGFQHSSATAC